MQHLIEMAATLLHQGGIIAYPTEGVYGFGCDPFNQAACNRLYELKQRNANKGVVLIAADWQQIQALTHTIPDDKLAIVLASWPGPYTWVFPASPLVPTWIRGQYDSIALRVTDHPIAKALCLAFNGPIVSTSANISNQPPTQDYATTVAEFEHQIDLILPGAIGDHAGPTMIRSALSGQVLRESKRG